MSSPFLHLVQDNAQELWLKKTEIESVIFVPSQKEFFYWSWKKRLFHPKVKIKITTRHAMPERAIVRMRDKSRLPLYFSDSVVIDRLRLFVKGSH